MCSYIVDTLVVPLKREGVRCNLVIILFLESGEVLICSLHSEACRREIVLGQSVYNSLLLKGNVILPNAFYVQIIVYLFINTHTNTHNITGISLCLHVMTHFTNYARVVLPCLSHNIIYQFHLLIK